MSKFMVLILFSFPILAHTLRVYPEAPLPIITIGHPTLRMTAKEVPLEEIPTGEMQQFFDDLIDTMKKAGGVGLAAPQVNVSKRVFVMKSGLQIPLTVVINPKVEYLNEFGTKKSTEGCLSIPGKQFRVNRYKKINLEYYNRHGEHIVDQAEGFKAVVAQHEYDHLNGNLISDLIGFIDDVSQGIDFQVPLM